MLNAFRRTTTSTTEVQTLQDASAAFARQLSDKKQLDTILLEGIVLKAAAPTPVPHLLGRNYIGWQVVDLAVNAVIYRDPAGTITDRFLTLKTTADCTVSLLVF